MPTNNASKRGSSRQKNPNGSGHDATKLIRENMKCPVCLEVLLPPIYQCETGHNICYLCVDEVNECPLCKSDYGDTRNYFAEELVNSMTFPCKYEEYGCRKTFLGSQLKEHQENCECQPYRCPELACPEVVGIHQMGRHLDKHGFKVMKGDVHQASLEILDDHFDRKTEYNPWRILVFNAEFYTVSTRSRDGLWFFWMYGLGLQKDLRKFSYEIVLFSDDKQYMYRGIVQSLRTSPEDIMKGGTCLITNDSVIKSIRKNGRIDCQVFVIQGKNWDTAKALVNRDRGKMRNLSMKTPVTSLHKGKRLISSTSTFSNNAQNAPSNSSVAKNNSRSVMISSLIKNTQLEIAKKEQAGSNRSSIVSNKLAAAMNKTRHGRVAMLNGKRSRSRSLQSIPHASAIHNVSDAEQLFVEKIRDTLRCPGCNDIITPPVFQCLIGHNVCHKCKNRRQDCPLCRAPLGESRNFFAEELLYKTYQRCVYAKHGCKVCLPSAQMRSHEILCDFAPFECPFNVCRVLLSADEMFEHLQTHQIAVVDKELKGDLVVPRNAPVSPVCIIPNILKIDKIPFYPIIVRDTDGSWVFYVITHRNTDFRYELMIKKQHKTLAYQGPVLSLRANHICVKIKGQALVASDKSIKGFKSNDTISYHIKISRIEGTEKGGSVGAKSAFQTPVSWVLTPRNGEVVSKAELFANKKTSVSPEEESEDEDDTRSIPHHATTETVYLTESEDASSIGSEIEVSSLDDHEMSASTTVNENELESESQITEPVPSFSGTTRNYMPEPQAIPPAPLEKSKRSKSNSETTKQEEFVYGIPPSIKSQKSSTSVRSRNTDLNANTIENVAKPRPASGSDSQVQIYDANNNRNVEPKKIAWKNKTPTKPVVSREQVAAKKGGPAQNILKGLETPPISAGEMSADSSASLHRGKILKHNGKRCKSATGHRVRMSDEVICCGCAGGTSSESSLCGQKLKKPVIKPTSVSSLRTAASKHVLTVAIREENELSPSAPSSARTKTPEEEAAGEEKEFDQLKKAIKQKGVEEVFEDMELLTAKSLHEIVNSVISLFTSTDELVGDSKENLTPKS